MPLKINDVFWTFQGEGANSGRRALFIRMPFCNLHCSWCDTEFNTYKDWEEIDLINIMRESSSTYNKFAVITGGEPTFNKHTPRVIQLLQKEGFEIAIESNGTFKIPMGVDFVTISPKRDNDFDINKDAYEQASEFKYVVDDKFDFNILTRHNDDKDKRHSLSPEYGNFKENMKKIMDFIAVNPMWRYSLQTHKILEIK